MADNPLGEAKRQIVSAEFEWIMECDRLLDDVVDKLAAAGVKVRPEQRVVVSRWLDLYSDDCPIPLTSRLAMLRGMLRGSSWQH